MPITKAIKVIEGNITSREYLSMDSKVTIRLLEVTLQPHGQEGVTGVKEGVEDHLGPQKPLLLLKTRVFRKIRVGGRLQSFANMWSRDQWAHRVVKKGLSWEWSAPPPPFKPFFQPASEHLED